MDRKSWKTILSRIFVDEVPERFITKMTIRLIDGSTIDVKDNQELSDAMETLRFDSEQDSVAGLEIDFNYEVIKKEVEQDINELLDPIMKKK